METKSNPASSLLFRPENMSKLFESKTPDNTNANKKKTAIDPDEGSYSPTRGFIYSPLKPKKSKYENFIPKKKVPFQEYMSDDRKTVLEKKKKIEKTEKKKKTPLSIQEKIIHKLTNTDDIDELYKIVNENKKEINKLHPLKSIKKASEKEEGKVNAIKSFEEKRFYQKVDEMNDFLLKKERFLGKKMWRYYGNNSKKKTEQISLDKDEKFCKKCLCMHLPGAHVNPEKWKLYCLDI